MTQEGSGAMTKQIEHCGMQWNHEEVCTYEKAGMSHRSPKKWMEGSDYEDKCSQWANDMERMSNHKKRKDMSERQENRGKM